MSAIISVENLSKKYLLRHEMRSHSYVTLREVITDKVRKLSKNVLKPFGLRPHELFPTREEFWALKDVSFEIKQGDRLGIIGRNGAGKSTLLKILSRIVEPTAGRARIKGRIASLLEVGTGFHPELTGRENIFLNGAILGMSRMEIKKKFDEIVDFAETEKFLDTPIKRYSSGMYVRLAFAVAAHLEPDILIVDEVLAVGDLHFQNKCLGKMREMGGNGRTVLYVSHNMASLRNLCDRGILIEQGILTFQGSISDAIDSYTKSMETRYSYYENLLSHSGRLTDMSPVITSVRLSSGGIPSRSVKTGQEVVFEIEFNSTARLDFVYLCLYTIEGERILSFSTLHDPDFQNTISGKGCMQCRISELKLAEGEYSIHVAMGVSGQNIDYVRDALKFFVTFDNYFGTGYQILRGQGNVVERSHWEVIKHPVQ
jgi:homopolymeric O-antigen transport system ATP-binding protein